VLLEGEVLAEVAQELERGGHDLRADPVAGEGDDRGHGAGGYLSEEVAGARREAGNDVLQVERLVVGEDADVAAGAVDGGGA
jgi:hypothetical protein